jgi:hypothetical protein
MAEDTLLTPYKSKGDVNVLSSQTAFPALLPNFSPLEVVKSGVVIPIGACSGSNFPSDVKVHASSELACDAYRMASIPPMIFPY